MAELTLPRGITRSFQRETAVEWLLAHKEIIAIAAIMAVAAALRFWGLGDKALHHDESLHAQFTWYLYNGDGYKHDPLMHGPFLFHTGALIFFLFGDTDYATRVLPALFGTILVGMPYLLRNQIGLKAVFIAAVLLTFSPTLLYYSRFFRNELYMAVWTFGIVICIWRYLDEAKPRYLYIMATLMALSFATKEVTFITVAIVLVFVDLMLAIELGRRRVGEGPSRFAVLARTVALTPVAWIIAALWPLLGSKPFGRDRLPLIGDVLVVLGTLTLPQFAAGIQVLPFVGDDGYRAASEQTLTVTTVLVLLLASAYVGLLWRPKVWLIAAASFFIPFVLLYTTFFTNQPAPWTDAFWSGQGGFWSGIWGSLDYWLGQHHVRRGDQPIYYYALMTPLYEFLPLLLALGGGLWLALRGDSLRRWLLFWTAGIFVGLSVAGEKMPWLEMHIALPLALTAALALSLAIDAVGLTGKRWLQAGAIALIATGAVLLLVDGSSTLRLIGAMLGAGLLGAVCASLVARDWQAFGRGALTVAVAALFTLTARAAITVSYENEDTPVEMMVYTQTSPDIPNLMDRIGALARESGLGLNLPIAIDSTDGYAWPWAWYLRDYHEKSYPNVAAPNYEPPPGAVLLINATNASLINPEGFNQERYRHRWWFQETYRDLLPPDPNNERDGTLDDFREIASNVIDRLTSWSSLKSLGDFFLYRRPVATGTGAVEGVAFFPDSLSAFDVNRAPAAPPPEPATLADGRIVFGRRGSDPGELAQPADVFVDGAGNIWVADAQNNRVQKFDANGALVGQLGRAGSASGAFNEPWSVAVDNDGFIYVADTWNHRVQKFAPDLTLVSAWGQPGSQNNPGPLDLYGPRDIVIAADGTLWITDTGNKRLLRFSPDGEPLGTFGSGGGEPGRLEEPVGLTTDAQGRFYVADTWNGRIQRFSPAFESPVSFPTGWSSREVFAKPYLAVLTDGRIVASDPGKGVLLLLGADGQPRGVWRPEADSQPIGVAATAEGGFVFSDGRRNQVQVVPAALVDQLFQ
jgi:predicted membrane-bound mannosyltransferase/sugar lactone lactonase YvrE